MEALLVFGLNRSLIFQRLYSQRDSVAHDVSHVIFGDGAPGKLSEREVLRIKRDYLVLAAVVAENRPPLPILHQLHELYNQLVVFCGPAPLSEVSLQRNFSSVFLLIDEFLFEGHPSSQASSLINLLIGHQTFSRQAKMLASSSTKMFTSLLSSLTGRSPSKQDVFTDQVTETLASGSGVGPGTGLTKGGSNFWWREGDTSYSCNEIFVDINENLHFMLSKDSIPLQRSIGGRIVISSHLNGLPKCLLRLNDHEAIPTISSHVSRQKTQSDREILFTPPHGDFLLAAYRLSKQELPLPVCARGRVAGSDSRMSLELAVSGGFKPDVDSAMVPLELVELRVPVPLTNTVTFDVSKGACRLTATKRTLIWTVGSLVSPGHSEKLSATFSLQAGPVPSTLAVAVSFTLRGLTLSGMKVDSLVVDETEQKTYKGVRYAVFGNGEVLI
ncbi:MAG: hypothetical protein KVP17_002779 [Porospora cf. gigantea B]|uniref:uncharacterized protein n=1 Tax=Porospora cf. gigantea B TaxID=2853592 RepID=UPI003571F6EC|nr:MAG: hypothetical protein KVP17_002779 [Porospora cf. gigantea B]